MPAALAACPYHSASESTVSWALRPLGFGSIQSSECSNLSSDRPMATLAFPNACRYAVTPRIATTFGFLFRTSSRSKSPPSRSCCFDNSSARAVAIGQIFEIPIPLRSNSDRTSRGKPHEASTSVEVMPERYNAGQNRFPGRAKCAFTAAVHSPGFIPTNKRLSFFGSTSSTV